MTGQTAGVGQHIAAARRARGLSQAQLAGRLNVSKSLLEKVERGERTATLALVSAVARLTGTSVAELTGQPYRGENRHDDRAHATIPDIRRAVLDHGPPTADARVRPLPELRRDVGRANQLRHAARLTALGRLVGPLIAEITTAVHTADGHEREAAFGLLVQAYAAANQVAYKLGYEDLSNLLVERIAWASRKAGDPLLERFSDWMRAGALRTVDACDQAAALLARSLGDFGAVDRLTPRALSMYGSLHLQAAMVAARASDASAVDEHLTEAGAAATRSGERDHFQLAFGPSNVAIYRVATAIELGDGTRAVEAGRRTVLPATVPPERSAHLHLDLARGWLWHGDRTRAVRSLLRAERLAPQQTRVHPMVRDTVRVLVRQELRRSDTLAGLAHRVGVVA